MLYGFAPLWNTEIVNFTPRVPFFLSHLLFGVTVGGWVNWQIGCASAACTCTRTGPGSAVPLHPGGHLIRHATDIGRPDRWWKISCWPQDTANRPGGREEVP